MNTLVKSFVCLLALCLASPAFAGSIPAYTADMVDVRSGNVVQKIAVAPDRIFSESLNAQGKREGVAIIRLDRKVMYLIIEESKSYMELPFTKDRFSAADLSMGMMQTKQEKVGEETVSGYRADKFRITVQVMGMSVQTYQWIAPEFDPMPIRTEASGVIQEMRNIKTGPPDASLFEIPQGYKRDTMMEQMMKGMMGIN